ncbi:MAG: mechanosensitive ion channel domain-containing protein [Alphaproteobacteria bacterium]
MSAFSASRNFTKINSHLCLGVCVCLVLLGMSFSALAQTSNDLSLTPPSFSVSMLNAQKKQLAENPNLTPEQIAVASESYDVGRTALENAASTIETAIRLQRDIDTAPATIERLREDIAKVQASQLTVVDKPENIITEENLLKSRQELLVKEGDLRALRTEITNYNTAEQALSQQTLRETLASARTRLADITTELDAMGEFGALDIPSRARKIALEARQYYHRTQILSLEREISGMPARQQILSLRKSLAQLKTQQVEQDVIYLQEQTGQRLLLEALSIRKKAMDTLAILESSHPFLIDFAAQNVAISDKLIIMADAASASPKLQADTRSQSDTIKNDLNIATRITELGNINRQSSAILRRLRNQRPSVNAVNAALDQTEQAILTATQDRLWAEEQLRDYPIGFVDVDPSLFHDRQTSRITPYTTSEVAQFQVLYLERRTLLQEVSDTAFARNAEADELRTLQKELLKHTEDLRTLLDQKLLWLPSVASIDGKWPEKAMRGAFETFDPEKISRAASVLLQQGQSYFFLVLLFISTIVGVLTFRPRLRIDIVNTSLRVGRVQKDNYWLTPRVIVLCGLIAIPVPLLLLSIGLLFNSSESSDQFIQSLGQAGVDVAGFAWFFLTWREWNREKSLLGAHYKLPAIIRKRVTRQLLWFIPVGGVTMALVTVTQNSRDPDVYEGVSLLAFIAISVALSVFGGKIIFAKREAFKSALSEESLMWRYRQIIAVLVVGLPIIAGLLAAAGYYDTARELLSRLFFSGGLLMGTYVAYGLIRRTVVIAQRRLALKQAVERREISLKARQEKEAAEERGDPPPPPVNYEEIDLESISRQSAQLLNTFMALGFAVLMWASWQDLLPALIIFDDVQLWQHFVTNSNGERVQEWASLWNIMQVVVIAIITFLAAKNVPGFLEVFILSRSRFDAGTRYAVVSVVGYLIVAIGVVTAFNKLGTEWSQFQWVVAALGVGIGFGLQEIIANFISGLIILFERPVRIGDYVSIGDQSGIITRIQIRATTLVDLDNREILIPNKELITGRVTNWTLSNATTRMIIRVGVAYGTDTDQARAIILGAVEGNPKILEKPKAQVFFLGFGDSSLDFEIRVFLRSFEDRFPVSHSIHTDVNRALADANISIPFPQRDLHIITPTPPSAPAPASPVPDSQ